MDKSSIGGFDGFWSFRAGNNYNMLRFDSK